MLPMASPLTIEAMPHYPKLLELYCFGCMGPIAVSPRAEVLKIVEHLHHCGLRDTRDESGSPSQH